MKDISSKIIVVTGNIGSGKSTVCEIFESLGAKVVYADKLAKQALDSEAQHLLIEKFGDSICTKNNFDKAKLTQLVFKDESKKKILEQILHPKIRAKSFQEFRYHINNNEKLIIYECPLFFESGMNPEAYKAIILVSADEENCINRASIRDRVEKEKILSRLKTQMPNSDKIAFASYIIENNKDIKFLKAQVEKLYDKLISMQ